MMRGRAGSISSKVQRVFLCCMEWVGILSCLTIPASLQVYGETTPTISSGMIDWKSRIVAGHSRIAEIRSNSVVQLRYDRPLEPTQGTELQQLWSLDGRYKVHKLELPERVSREAALAEPRLMNKPDLLRVVTPQYEFSLNRFSRDDEGNTILGPLKVKTTAIAKNDLKAWQKRLLWQFTVNAWSATTFCDFDSQGFFAEPPRAVERSAGT